MLLDSPEQKAEEDEVQMKYLEDYARWKKRRKPISDYPDMLDVFICIMLFVMFLLVVTFTPQLAAWIVKQ